MATPNIYKKSPAVEELEPGTYYWCSCGLSKKNPYCDGSHKETNGEFEPLRFEVDEKKKFALCRCKFTSRPPLCDGTHKSL